MAVQRIQYSGAAKGADRYWEQVGRQYDVVTINYKVDDYVNADKELKEECDQVYEHSCEILGRPVLWPMDIGGQLPRRNWLQVRKADAVFAIGHILAQNEVGAKGFRNKSQYAVVDGGTGYAVQYGITLGIPVCVFDQQRDAWYLWNNKLKKWFQISTPFLTNCPAVVGTRELLPNGEQAIREVYRTTYQR